MEKQSKQLDVGKIVEMIHDEVEEATISGDPCPNCGDEDYFGHLELTSSGGKPTIGLFTDCLWCGYSSESKLENNG